jgi:hypothetical protein
MSRSRASAILVAALVLAHTGPARAEAPAWDQRQVTALAQQLVKVLGDIATAAREAPPQATAIQQRTRDAAISGIHRVRSAASDYLSKLRAGQDRDLTESRFRIVRDSFRDQLAVARDAVAGPKMDELLSKANGLLDELGQYYPDA